MASINKSFAEMKIPYLIPILAIFILYSCKSNNVKLLEDGPKFSVNKGKKEAIDFSNPNNGAGGAGAAGDNTGSGALNGPLNLASTSSASAASKKIDLPTIVEELPRSYKQRKFISNISGLSYDVFMIPGNIVKYNPVDTSYDFKTLKAIIIGNKPPIATTINDGVLYSAKINANTSFNGSYLIGGLNVASNEIMELNIQDAAKSFVPDSLIDVNVVKQIAAGIPDDQRKNYFYVKSVIVTYIENRKYTEAKFDASINSCFVTAGGKTYSSNEKFERERIISVFLVSLDNLLSAP